MVRSGFSVLSEGCIAIVISFTSPRDACRLACVSTTFRSAADSDFVWDHFLPPEYSSLSSSSMSPLLSKKDLYRCHCPVLIDGDKLSFWLDKPSRKKCYMISARKLRIVWGKTPHVWSWISLPNARFSEVAELRDVCWFEIHGEISTSLLSPKTTYVAYLVFKLLDDRVGFKNTPIVITVGLAGNDDGQTRTVYFEAGEQEGIAPGDHAFLPENREDGWLESELGEYFYGGDEDGKLSMSILEKRDGGWKRGLIFQGIEIRPKKE